MNELVFIILVYMTTGEQAIEFKSPKVIYHSAEECEQGRHDLFGKAPEILARTACANIMEAGKKVEKPKTSFGEMCKRPPSAGYTSGMPCISASYVK